MNMQYRFFRKRRGALRAVALAAILSGGAAFTQHASAGCLDVPRGKLHATNLQGSESATGLMRVADEDYAPSFFHAPIVGLWAFTYISKGNEATYHFTDGMTIDAGNTLWFADGNEITYSAIRNPIVGATCLGIWKRTGEHSYVLNHIGLSWDPTAATSAPPAADLARRAARRSSSNMSFWRATARAIPEHSRSVSWRPMARPRRVRRSRESSRRPASISIPTRSRKHHRLGQIRAIPLRKERGGMLRQERNLSLFGSQADCAMRRAARRSPRIMM